MSKITVQAHPENGIFQREWEKGDQKYANVMLDTRTEEVVSGGLLVEKRRTAFFTFQGEQMIEKYRKQLKDGGVFPLAGKIIVKEATKPFYDGQDPKINPSTGEVVTHNGEAIYRTTEFTSDEEAGDQLLKNDSSNITEAEVVEVEEEKSDALQE